MLLEEEDLDPEEDLPEDPEEELFTALPDEEPEEELFRTVLVVEPEFPDEDRSGLEVGRTTDPVFLGLVLVCVARTGLSVLIVPELLLLPPLVLVSVPLEPKEEPVPDRPVVRTVPVLPDPDLVLVTPVLPDVLTGTVVPVLPVYLVPVFTPDRVTPVDPLVLGRVIAPEPERVLVPVLLSVTPFLLLCSPEFLGPYTKSPLRVLLYGLW